ncbi:MAG: hypothetical protein JKP98_23555 [Rhodobacteraceae bacterium]|jgi:hypothetical protein|nr:hypothetical protein [Paracoccaceae bacterium]MBL4558948.1 hypothetical protein [Paracoccaceae bacterium]HBH00195.1 hypothetical protein [Paracoccaceae bacterium]
MTQSNHALPGAVALLTFALTCASAPSARADEDLAKQLNNPVAALISFPIQSNFDYSVGPNDGWRMNTNIQPVIPFELNKNWNMISRTILPVIYQDDVFPGQNQFGLSDTTQSLFFSPVAPTKTSLGNLIWGAGPVAEIPTSTDRRLGGGYFGLGPTGVALIQQGPWTYGALANHVWGVTETRSDLPSLNRTFLQPFLAYTTKESWTFSVNGEMTYDWTSDELSGPVNFGIAKVTKIGEQNIQLQGRLRWWAADTETSPEGLGFTVAITFLFPK